MTETTLDTDALRQRWTALLAEEPKLRIRNAAARLGVSEAELLATGTGRNVRRISAEVAVLLPRIEALGEVMALTRNDVFVHEKDGVYLNAEVGKHASLVLGSDIDLRIFPSAWKIGFAVETEGKGGLRRSLQFFDGQGGAVHKIFLREGSDLAAYEALVNDLLLDDQSPVVAVDPPGEPAVLRSDEEVPVDAMVADWKAMADTHDFFQLLRRHQVGRVQALRLVPDDLARSVDNGALRRVLEGAVAGEVPIMVFVRNPGTFQIHHGPVRRIVDTGEWLNILDPGFNLHVREGAIAASWVVRKPTETGWVTSLELYDADEQLLALLFGERAEGDPENPDWRALLD